MSAAAITPQDDTYRTFLSCASVDFGSICTSEVLSVKVNMKYLSCDQLIGALLSKKHNDGVGDELFFQKRKKWNQQVRD